MLSNIVTHPVTSAASGGAGIVLMDAVQSPSTIDQIFKIVVGIVSLIPAIKSLIKKKKKEKTPDV